MLTTLVVAETCLLVLLGLLMVALLRAYADVQRQLAEHVAGPRVGGTLSDRIPPPTDRPGAVAAPPLVGQTLTGDEVHLALDAGGPNTLIAFLSSGCAVCHRLWNALSEEGRSLPRGARVVIVTKDTTEESPSQLLELAPGDIPVIQSSRTWEAYEVPGAPYFVYVDGGSGQIHGEGSAEGWDQILSLLKDAILDSEIAAEKGRNGGRKSGRVSPAAARAIRAEQALVEAGIPLDDPSFYPTRAPETTG